MKALLKVADEFGLSDRLLEAVEYYDMSTRTGLIDYLGECRFTTNGRSVRRAGCYRPRDKVVELHPKLLVAGRECHRDSTFLHEVAHAIVSCLWPHASAHGWEWKRVMRQLGESPDRTHNYDFLHTSANAKLIYACTHCETEIYAQRAKKHDPSRYYHKACGRKGALYLKQNNVTGQRFPNPKTMEYA